jgi:putative PIN family toxin of toxin-antitoxin system
MRVVLDTNILISACWKPGGLEELVLERGLAGDYQLVASPVVWAEYEQVLRRPKFARLAERVDQLLARLHPVVEMVDPTTPVTLATDPDDNCILEAALTAGADYVVTGNLRDFPSAIEKARIVNARLFLDAIGQA